MIVDSMHLEDVQSCVGIHIEAFPSFFLTFLGRQFLNVLYSAIISDVSGIGRVIKTSEQMTGFVIGSTQPIGLYKRLLIRYWWQFGWAALPAFLRNPTILPRLLRAFSMPLQEHPIENCGTLMSIAVTPDCQGQGVGKLLIKAFLDEARLRGLNYVNLTTDASDNKPVNQFYQSLGFSFHRKYLTPEGRIMHEYLIEL